ncbi:MAG: hypothetical protein KDA97_01705 [Acidimicrobiales bacterium]|nr:hypothetical protein [Acidimicrobiales bacterium]
MARSFGWRRWLALVVVALVASFFLARCVAGSGTAGSDAGRAGSERPEGPVEACELVSAAQVDEILGGSFEAVADPVDGSCTYADVDRGARVVISDRETRTRQAFEALVDPIGARPFPGVGDEAHLRLGEVPPTAVLVARVGGQAVMVDLLLPELGDPPESTASGDDTDPAPTTIPPDIEGLLEARVAELASIIMAKLPSVDFDEDLPDEARATCAAIPLDDLARAVGLEPSDASLTTLGEAACQLSSGAGTNLVIEAVDATGDETALGVARSYTVDGEETVVEPEPVEGVGDRAVWIGDPISGVSGDLYAQYGTTVVRITSSGPSPGTEARLRALAAMDLVGPILSGT